VIAVNEGEVTCAKHSSFNDPNADTCKVLRVVQKEYLVATEAEAVYFSAYLTDQLPGGESFVRS
jgi:hypothetical protein